MSITALIRIAAIAALVLSGCGESDQEKARRHLETGRKLAAAKDWRRAIIHLKVAVQHAPGQPDPLYELGMTQLAARDAAAAFASLYRAAHMTPPHAKAKLKLAELMIASGDRQMIAASHRHIDAVLAADPNNVEALQCRAAALFSAGDLSGTEAAANQVLALQPDSAGATLTLALVKMVQSDYRAAESLLRTSIERNPQSAAAAVVLGKFYLLTGRRIEAQAQFERAVQLDSQNAPALVELAALRMAAGQAEQAGDIYKRLSKLPFREYHVLHAMFLAQTGDKAGAVRELERLSKQDPEDREIRSNLVRAYVQAGRPADGERTLSTVLSRNPKDIDALLQVAELFPHTRTADQLEASLRTVLKYRPRSGTAHFLLAQVYRRKGAAQSRLVHLHDAIECDPSLLVARLALAELRFLSGDAEGSLRIIDAAPPSHRNTVPAVVQRIWALLELGRDAEAEKALEGIRGASRVPDVMLQQAVVAIRRKRVPSAIGDLEEVLKQRPEDIRALRMLAGIYADQGNHAYAAARVRRQAEAHPTKAPLWECLGSVLARAGDVAGARHAYETALRHEPGHSPVRLELARLDIAGKLFDSARRRLGELKPPAGNAPETLLLRAIVEEQSGATTAAIPFYRKVLELDARNQIALNNLAYRLAQHEDTLDEGLHLAQRAREVSGSPAVEHTLGWIYYRKGLYRTAVQHLSAAAKIEPTARRKYDLALAYLKTGKSALAQQTYASARALDPALPALPAAAP